MKLVLYRKKHFSTNIFSIDVLYLFATIITSQCIALSAIAVRQEFFKSNRGKRITFPSNPLFFLLLFYAHRISLSTRMSYWMFWTYIDPYWGSSLSKLALNVRKSHVRLVKFLHATFASLSSRKKKHFSSNTFSR